MYISFWLVKTNSGDNMILVYMENIDFMRKIINYLDNTNVKYTTNLSTNYDYILIAELNNKIINFAKEQYQIGKKIIFLSYLEEKNISFYYQRKSKKSKDYLKKLNDILLITSKVFVHFEATRKIITENKEIPVIIVPKEIPVINISKNNKDIYNKYKIKRRVKKIIVVDNEYKNIEKLYVLANTYPKYNFIYFGYNPDYLISKKQRDMINNLSSNVTLIKYNDLNVFSDVCKISDIVIFLEDYGINIDYVYITLLFKKQLVIKENKLFEDLFINSKNAYTFKSKEDLLLKFKKIVNNRVSNLTDVAYFLIKDNTFDEIIKKYNAYLI